MEEVSLKPKFCAALECPKCRDFYTPPVSLCPFGHTVCGPCKGTSSLCPICQNPYGPAARNFTLERMLEQITVTCKYPNCNKEISLAERQNHARTCAFSPMVQCFAGCDLFIEDIVAHLIEKHEYKEIVMQAQGGLRSFSGPQDSWISDTEWPRGVWRLGEEPIIVHARSFSGAFHISLYTITRSKAVLSLTIKSEEASIHFKGKAPHVSELQTNKTIFPHLNCDCAVLLSSFLKRTEEDAEILKLWVEVERLS